MLRIAADWGEIADSVQAARQANLDNNFKELACIVKRILSADYEGCSRQRMGEYSRDLVVIADCLGRNQEHLSDTAEALRVALAWAEPNHVNGVVNVWAQHVSRLAELDAGAACDEMFLCRSLFASGPKMSAVRQASEPLLAKHFEKAIEGNPDLEALALMDRFCRPGNKAALQEGAKNTFC